MPLGKPTLTLDGNNYTITGTLTTNNTLNTTRTFINDTIRATTWVDDPRRHTLVVDLTQGPTFSQRPLSRLTDAACPTCGKSGMDDADCADAYHSK